jgi:hypothetical protein
MLKLLNNTGQGGKGRRNVEEGGYIDLSTMHIQTKMALTNQQTPKQ